MKTFGETIKAARLAKEWPQAMFAHALGLTGARLCDYENDRRLPPQNNALICKMARFLDLPDKPLVRLAMDTRAKPELPLDIKILYLRHPAYVAKIVRRAKVLGLGLALKKLGG